MIIHTKIKKKELMLVKNDERWLKINVCHLFISILFPALFHAFNCTRSSARTKAHPATESPPVITFAFAEKAPPAHSNAKILVYISVPPLQFDFRTTLFYNIKKKVFLCCVRRVKRLKFVLLLIRFPPGEYRKSTSYFPSWNTSEYILFVPFMWTEF